MEYGVRALIEETGASLPESTRLTKFEQGKKADWFYLHIDDPSVFKKGFKGPYLHDIKRYHGVVRKEQLPPDWYEPFGH